MGERIKTVWSLVDFVEKDLQRASDRHTLNIYYLLDTSPNTYRVSQNVNALTPSTALTNLDYKSIKELSSLSCEGFG